MQAALVVAVAATALPLRDHLSAVVAEVVIFRLAAGVVEAPRSDSSHR